MQVVADEGLAVVELPQRPSWTRPRRSQRIRLIEQLSALGAALHRGLGGLVLLQPVEVLEEQEPRGLLGVVEFGGAAGLLAEDVVDGLERLLEHD